MTSMIIAILIIILPSPCLMTYLKIISHIKVKNFPCHELQQQLLINFLLHKQYMVKNGSHFNHEICTALGVPLQNTDSLWSSFLTFYTALFLILIFIFLYSD